MSAVPSFKWSVDPPRRRRLPKTCRWMWNWPSRCCACDKSVEADWVFASHEMKGKQPLWPDSLWYRHGKPAVKAAGVTKKVSYHTFRHTFGTLLNANGENPKVVQELLRHATLKVTTDTYLQALSPD